MIFSTRWLEDDSYIFKKACTPYDKHSLSDVVFNNVTARMELQAVSDYVEMNRLLGISENEDGTNKLISIAKELIGNNYGKVKLLQSDIDKKSWKYLSSDIFCSLKKYRTDTGLINILSNYVANKWTPRCYCKEENGYQAFGISHLPDGCIPDLAWSRALIMDFSNECDEVILALHGRTDWWKRLEDTGFGYMPEVSQEMSKEFNRSIRIYIFLHNDSNRIASAIKMSEDNLSNIWDFINNEK